MALDVPKTRCTLCGAGPGQKCDKDCAANAPWLDRGDD